MSRIKLYPCFNHWQEKGNIKIISDTHFSDTDRSFMGYVIDEKTQANNIINNLKVGDTLVHLGDVGDMAYMDYIKSRMPKVRYVLITGNHDAAETRDRDIWDEIYEGPVMISDRIMLSHEPMLNSAWFNIHGHDHTIHNEDGFHMNLAANVFNYGVLNLNNTIKMGLLKDVKGIHRITIDNATEKKVNRSHE